MTIRTFYKSTKINTMIENTRGTKFWFQNGKRHRDNDLPAIEHSNDDKEWYINGELHRENDLPAVEFSNGDNEWYKNGIEYFPNETKSK